VTDETITLKILAQDLASGNVSKFIGGLDAMAKKGGLVGAMAQGVGQSFGQMLNPIGLATKGFEIVGDVVSDSIEAFGEAQKVQAQTEAALKSTGAAAGLTADQIGDLAGSIAAYSGTDDEAIQKGENLLLTFTNIKDAAGDGNDIFDQTTKIMVDMAQAMGTDAAGQAIQLGKALNDPVKGITALTRVGVTFTAEQKAQIAAMEKAGDTAGAQRVILAELNKEFGGSAAAFGKTLPGSIARFDVALGDVEEKIGGMLAGPLADLASWLADSIPKVAELVGQANDLATSLGNLTGDATPEQPRDGLGWDINTFIFGEQALNDVKGGKFYGTILDSIGDGFHSAIGQEGPKLRGEIDTLVKKPIEDGLADGIKGGFEGGLGSGGSFGRPLVSAVSNMGHDARAALRERFREMETDTLALGGDLAGDLKSTSGIIKNAMNTVTDAMEHPWRLARKRMELEAALTGQKLGDGLKSKNPYIRAVAQQQQALLEAQWEKITGQAWVEGSDAGSSWAGGYRSHAIVGGVDTGSSAYQNALRQRYRQQHRGHAAGGTIEMGDWGYVGETAMERIDVTPSGAVVTPLGGGRADTGGDGIHIHFHTAVVPGPIEAQRFAQAYAPAIRDELRRTGALSPR
jgi:hypothetical protein